MTELKQLSSEEARVILHKGTEKPFSGKYCDFFKDGFYLCKHCGTGLFESKQKFKSECGWPSFDDAIEGMVKRTPDPDGKRVEITCVNCGGHLGHVFEGEGLTQKNTRYCVNSISLDFIPKEKTDYIIVAGGCFWGVEHLMRKTNGVIFVASGYIGGHIKNPTYKQVCNGNTGHLEAVKITFDKSKTNPEELFKLFFEIHDFTQSNGQGNDIGEQYISAIFYSNEEQKKCAENLMNTLKEKGFKNIATKLLEEKPFYAAEQYHQAYYLKNGKKPYCHFKKKIF